MKYEKYSPEDMREFRYLMGSPMPEHNIKNLIQQSEARKKAKKQNTSDKK